MKNKAKISLVLALGCALVAYAGTRAKDSNGSIPTSATDGVSLDRVTGCRISVRVMDGGTVNGGTLVSYYYDPVLGWVRSPTALDCTLEANKLIDGGAPASQVCSDTQVLAQYGRVGVAVKSLVNGAASSITATSRIECWGPELP